MVQNPLPRRSYASSSSSGTVSSSQIPSAGSSASSIPTIVANTPTPSSSSGHHRVTMERIPEAILEYLLPKDSLFFELKALERQIDDKLLHNQQRLCDIQFKKERSPRHLLIRIGNTCNDQPINNSSISDKRVDVPSVGNNSKDTECFYAAYTPSPPLSNNSTNNNPNEPIAEKMMDIDNMFTKDNDKQEMFANPPSWTLHIDGKLESTVGRPSRFPAPPFTHWVKSLKAEFTDDQGQLVYVEEWKKDASTKLTDALTIKRMGSQPLNVKIILDPDYHVEKFKCSLALSQVIFSNYQENYENEHLTASKAHVIVLLWQYIKLHKLQVSEKQITCDDALQRVFGVNKITLADIPVLVADHLSPPDPIVIDYRLHLDVSSYTSTRIYDLYVEYDETTLRAPKLNHPALLTLANDISSLDKRIQETIELLKCSIGNYKLLHEFSEDPVHCCERLIAKQCRDVSLLTGTMTTFSGEDIYRQDIWQGPTIEYALLQFVASMSDENKKMETEKVQ